MSPLAITSHLPVSGPSLRAVAVPGRVAGSETVGSEPRSSGAGVGAALVTVMHRSDTVDSLKG